MERGRFVRALLAGVGSITLIQSLAVAAPPQHQEHPNAIVVRPQRALLAGRVVTVRRLTREVTIRTATGTVRSVTVARDAAVRARGAAGLNAVRSGARVELDTVPGGNGQLLARSVTVR